MGSREPSQEVLDTFRSADAVCFDVDRCSQRPLLPLCHYALIPLLRLILSLDAELPVCVVARGRGERPQAEKDVVCWPVDKRNDFILSD